MTPYGVGGLLATAAFFVRGRALPRRTFFVSTWVLRVRAFAILLAAEMMVVPISMLLYGFLIEAAGLRAGLLFFAAGNALLAAFAIGNGRARRLAQGAAGA